MYARFTEYLRDLMENELTRKGLDKALSTYPLYQPSKTYDLIPTREELNKKILNHYKYREIGFETVGRFLDELEITMCEIMPLYNERLKSIAIMADIEDPFATVDFIEEYTEESSGESSQESSGTNKGTSERTGSGSATGSENSQSESSNENSSNSNSNQNSSSKKVHSETPQDTISITAENIDGVPYADDVEWNKDSATDVSNTTSEGTASGSSTSTSQSSNQTQESSETNGEVSANSSSTTQHSVYHKLQKKGAMGVTTFGHDMIEFRTSFIDVMDEIINDERLGNLFMKIW